MVLREEGEAVIAVGQASHAWLSGQLARAWGNERLGALARREEVILAAEQHDVGWAEWDLIPTLDPRTGLPHAFADVGVDTHLAVWRDAPRRLLSQSVYAALLVSLHGTALQERRDLEALDVKQAAAVHAYLADQRAFQHRLTEDLDADRDLLAHHRQLLWTWDGLSLALLLRWDPFVAEDVPTATGPAELRLSGPTLDPWPFASERLSVHCEGRRLEGRFADEDELARALAEAPPEPLTFTLAPA